MQGNKRDELERSNTRFIVVRQTAYVHFPLPLHRGLWLHYAIVLAGADQAVYKLHFYSGQSGQPYNHSLPLLRARGTAEYKDISLENKLKLNL